MPSVTATGSSSSLVGFKLHAAAGINGDQTDNSADVAGAAYLFGITAAAPTPTPANIAPTPGSVRAPRKSSTAKTRIRVRCSVDATQLLYRIKLPGQRKYGRLHTGRAADGVGSLVIKTKAPGTYQVSVIARDPQGLKSRVKIVRFERVEK